MYCCRRSQLVAVQVCSSMQARGKTEGFALVIALTLMAFILMLLLSMSTLVRLETRSSIDRLRAQNNASVSYTHLTLPTNREV